MDGFCQGPPKTERSSRINYPNWQPFFPTTVFRNSDADPAGPRSGFLIHPGSFLFPSALLSTSISITRERGAITST